MKPDRKSWTLRKKTRKKLSLHKETLQRLAEDRLHEVVGGRTRNTCGVACTVIDCP